MELVDPIMNQSDIMRMAEYLYKHNKRDYVLFEIGINLGMRVTDFTSQKVEFYREACKQEYVDLTPQKTRRFKKRVRLPINKDLKVLIENYIKNMDDDEWMFPSQKGGTPITRQHIHRIMSNTAKELGVKGNIGCHSLRKTFGYWHYYYNKDIRLLMEIFNHSSEEVTLRYIGVNEEKKVQSMDNMKLGLFMENDPKENEGER